MTDKISRRDFMKISGVATAATILTGCGPSARYVTRKPYSEMPEYNQTGISTYFASTCRECPAGCGIIVRTMEGRAIKIEGNPNHPVNKGKLCSRGLAAIQGLYNPDRVTNPRKNAARGSELYDLMKWNAALPVLQKALEETPAQEIGIITNTYPDHTAIFFKEWAAVLGANEPIQYSPYDYFSQSDALVTASKNIFGEKAFPFFDIGNTDLVVSLGADFLQGWVSPVAYNREYASLRSTENGRRGKLIVFESRQSLTGGVADEWYSIRPGSFPYAAQAIGSIIANLKGIDQPDFSQIPLQECIKQCGLSEEVFKNVAEQLVAAEKCVTLPGSEGEDFNQVVAGTELALKINKLTDSLGKPGGLYLNSSIPGTGSYFNIKPLIDKMNNGEITLLLVHGVNPAFELPAHLGFSTAMKKVKHVFSFSSFPDETSALCDYVFPDNTPLESWGFHHSLAGTDRLAYSGSQPVISPFFDTKSTIDVLLSAVGTSKTINDKSLPYNDEVEFIQSKLLPFIGKNGSFTATNMPVFWSSWLQYGGWWEKDRNLEFPVITSPDLIQTALVPSTDKNVKELTLKVFQTQMGDGNGANRPWLQETPNPQTTVMWNNWVEINPETASRLGIKSDDIVKIKSQYGEIEAIVYEYPAMHLDCAAISFGQGHTALGRYARGRGSNPSILLPYSSPANNSFQTILVQVTITPTGKRKTLARFESKEGVYGHE